MSKTIETKQPKRAKRAKQEKTKRNHRDFRVNRKQGCLSVIERSSALIQIRSLQSVLSPVSFTESKNSKIRTTIDKNNKTNLRRFQVLSFIASVCGFYFDFLILFCFLVAQEMRHFRHSFQSRNKMCQNIHHYITL